jgi:hypothetical protein
MLARVGNDRKCNNKSRQTQCLAAFSLTAIAVYEARAMAVTSVETNRFDDSPGHIPCGIRPDRHCCHYGSDWSCWDRTDRDRAHLRGRDPAHRDSLSAYPAHRRMNGYPDDPTGHLGDPFDHPGDPTGRLGDPTAGPGDLASPTDSVPGLENYRRFPLQAQRE